MNKKQAALLILLVIIGGVWTAYLLSARHAPMPGKSASTRAQAGAASAGHVPDAQTVQRPQAAHQYLPKPADSGDSAELTPFKPDVSIDHPLEVIGQALALAESGSPSAMRWMALTLKHCSEANMGSDAEIEDEIAQRSIGIEAMKRHQGHAVDTDQQLAYATRWAHALESLRDECRQIPEKQIDSWQEWLEKSAAAGDAKARERLAHTVMKAFKDPTYREMHYDEFQRRNDQAADYLYDSVAHGDCRNEILNGFRWVVMDPARTYIYQGLLWRYALQDLRNDTTHTRKHVDTGMAELSAELNRLRANVPDAQLADAEAASDYLLNHMCKQF